jgi:hypothetical protein
LTFNLGLRWEYFGPPHNFRPGTDSNFYFGSADTPVPSANVFFPVDSPQFVGMNTLVGRAIAGPDGVVGTADDGTAADVRATCGPSSGTSGRNVFTGPGFANVDFGIHKKSRVTEGSSLQLQANAFNLFNHPNFRLPVRNLASSQVGRSISTVGTPRVIQLAIRFDF